MVTVYAGNRFPIVGIGTAAGGVEALEVLLRALPREVDAAFIVVACLDQPADGLPASRLQRLTQIPVAAADDQTQVAPGRIYVMPPRVSMTIAEGRLHLRSIPLEPPETHPIDLFFSSLALERGEHAVGILLAGTGSDGTLGAKAIKEYGGFTLAQVSGGLPSDDPDAPQAAVAAGLVDRALAAEDMPKRLIAHIVGLQTLDRLELDGESVEMRRMGELRGEFYDLLRNQVGHDFSGYKIRTFNRRVQRRVQLLNLAGVDAYLAKLRQDTSEVAALFRDLLVNVTNFFRDIDAFAKLKEIVVPALFEKKGREDTIRIWVPGCSTGEEVYSIAILVREHMDEHGVRPRVQIFATDIDERSLEIARAARYPEPILDAVSPERRRRFFVAEGSSYVVAKHVRELCIFSPHSLIRDPPFSRMDLVSCRNLLIYLAAGVQEQVIPLFHYSLRPQGYLFLGTSENIGQFTDLFSPIDKRQRIYRAREGGVAARLPFLPRPQHSEQMLEVPGGAKLSSMQKLRQAVEARVIERFAPAYVVINGESDIVLFSSRTGKYLEPPAGVPSRQLFALARRGIRLELRSAIREAISERSRVERTDLAIELDDGRLQLIGVVVDPVDLQTEEPLFVVLFNDIGVPLDREQAMARALGDHSATRPDLERELTETRERLQSLVEEYETALEELKSSNEELVSVNEDLQSANEELEASKEELQSLNEELHTVNTELGQKIDEIDQSNSELRNLFDTSKMATMFVYGDLTIRNFTPLAANIFNLLPTDRGRSLTIFTSPLVYPEFLNDIARTAKRGIPAETNVVHENGITRYLVRIEPYHSSPGFRDGATATFIDITSLGTEGGELGARLVRPRRPSA